MAVEHRQEVIQRTASANLTDRRAIAVVGNQAVHADKDTTAHRLLVRGLLIGTTTSGATATICVFGPVFDATWTWTAGLPVYVGSSGALTQTPPSTGFRVPVGVAFTTTILFVTLNPLHTDETSVGIAWGSPGAESSNSIEITGSVVDYLGIGWSTSFVDVTVIVSDGAADSEPSHTATLSAAGTPVGTVLGGSGTATLTIRSASGAFKVKVTETAAGNRYLWVRNGGNMRFVPHAVAGVVELVFA